MLRTIYERFQLNRYWLYPFGVLFIVWVYDIQWAPVYPWVIAVLYLAWLVWKLSPRPDWWDLAVHYGHEELFRKTVLTGVSSTVVALITGYDWLFWVAWTDVVLAVFSVLYRLWFIRKTTGR